MLAVGASHAAFPIQHCKWFFCVSNDHRDPRCQTRFSFLDIKTLVTLLTMLTLPDLDRERLHRHNRTGHNWSAVTATRDQARPVLHPENVDDLRTLVAIVTSFLNRESKWVEAHFHSLARCNIRPHTFVSARAVA